MKIVSFIAAFLLCNSVFAQDKYKIELSGGVNMTRMHTRTPYNSAIGSVNIKEIALQSGYEFGGFIHRKNQRFIPLLGIHFRRSISYATLRQRIYVDAYYSTGERYRDVNYLRRDISTADFSLLMQASLGKEYNIRLTGGLVLSSVLINRSRTNFWYHENYTTYDQTTGLYVQVMNSEYHEQKLPLKQISLALCGGVVLPVIGTKWSVAALWRYGFTQSDQLFGLAEQNMMLSAVYALN